MYTWAMEDEPNDMEIVKKHKFHLKFCKEEPCISGSQLESHLKMTLTHP